MPVFGEINTDDYSREELLEFYDNCKNTYYSDEESPLTDLEFDEFEKFLGLENQGYVGTHHQESYTEKHPFVMGSLSKVQVLYQKNGSIKWGTITNAIQKYISKAKQDKLTHYEITPKLDGCSFEFVFNRDGDILAASTRGDEEYGKNILPWAAHELELHNWKENVKKLMYHARARHNLTDNAIAVIRGEVLIALSTYKEKWEKKFKMPRSFVSGCLGRDWEDNEENREMRQDLSFVCYDYNIKDDDRIIELPLDGEFITGNSLSAINIEVEKLIDPLYFKTVYEIWEDKRKLFPYALDGFVLKPNVEARNPRTKSRPDESLAVKFLPEIKETVIEDIVWSLGKTGEYFPKAICAPVILGGKEVRNVTLSNIGKIRRLHVGIGSRIKMSLSGDIISFLYEVLTESDNVTIPEPSCEIGSHLYGQLTEEEKFHLAYMTSVETLKVKGIGSKVAEKLYSIYPVNNILMYMHEDIQKLLRAGLGASKSTDNIIDELNKRSQELSLFDVVLSMGFPMCGSKASMQVARVLSGLKADFTGLPKQVEIWARDDDSEERRRIRNLCGELPISQMKDEGHDENATPVILTGSPKVAGYSTKSEFLKHHPEFYETSNWKECQILFTDDLNSESSKMNKAKKSNIEIKLYF